MGRIQQTDNRREERQVLIATEGDDETQVRHIRAEWEITEAGNLTGHGEPRQDKHYQNKTSQENPHEIINSGIKNYPREAIKQENNTPKP